MGPDDAWCDIDTEAFGSCLADTWIWPDERPRQGIHVNALLKDHSRKLRTAWNQGLKDLVGSFLVSLLCVVVRSRIKHEVQDSKFLQVFQMILQNELVVYRDCPSSG